MWKWLALFIFFFAPAWSLSDNERTKAVHEFFERDMQRVPTDLQKWLQKQAIPHDQFGVRFVKLDFRQIAKKISEIEGYFKKINSSSTKVFTPFQEYILCSAPSEQSIGQFWQEILDNNVKTIVVLLMPADTGSHPPAYWQKTKFPVQRSEWKIEFSSEKTLITSITFPHVKLVQRVFIATNTRSKEARRISHLHFENWPDHGAPIHEVFCYLLDYIDEVHPWNEKPILVHCAGGIGRTGTFVAAHSLRKEIKLSGLPEEFNIPRRIIELRTQRAKLAAQACQLHAVYAAVNQLIDTP
jgi:protein tyrosine phosphatase